MSFLENKRKHMTKSFARKNKKRWLYAAMALAIVLGAVPTGTAVNALTTQSVGLETVATDADAKRTDFEAAAKHPDADRSFTSVKVEVPDEITNDATYKQDAINNGTYQQVSNATEFVNAWNNASVTYIDVIGSAGTASNTTGERPNGASVIIQGNGNKVDLGTNTLKVGKITSDTTITLNNVDMQENITRGTGTSLGADTKALIAANGGVGTKLTVNMHDVSVSKGASSSTNGPVHGVYGNGARVVLSGSNTFEIAGSIAQKVGSVEIANHASVKLARDSNDLYTGEFIFDGSGSVSKVNGLLMGDYSKNEANQYDNGSYTNGTGSSAKTVYAKEAQPVTGKFSSVTTGDKVTWVQKNFGYFTKIGSYDTGDYIFGQENMIDIPIVTNGNVLTIAFGKRVVFNAGTTLDIKQAMKSTSSPIQTVSGSIRFISPKSLHMAVQNANGTTSEGNILNATEGAPLYITNSSIQAWQNFGAMGSNNPNFTETFRVLEADSRGSKLNGAPVRKTDLFGKDKKTREFQTLATGVGEIKINYIDQNGNKIKVVDYPLADNVNFVGQSYNLANKEYALDQMPAGYKWAIDEQVPASAKTDAQSLGDSTNDNDNGDAYGQANYAIVPMKGETYEYNIYVYTEGNPNVTYTYVNPFTGLEIKSDKATVGSEAAGTANVPAHVGNTIDWTSKLYTETNVPTGYLYVPSNLLPSNMAQPTTTEVKDTVTPSNTFIYVYDPSYKGSIELSAVTDIDFGNQLISPESRGNIYPATFKGDLIVNDDRSDVKDGWNLSVEQTTPLTSTDGKGTVLNNSLFFRETDGGTLTPLDNGGDLVVYDYTNQEALRVKETVNLTSKWNQKADGAGFYLKDSGKFKAGDYATVLTWTLGAGPSF